MPWDGSFSHLATNVWENAGCRGRKKHKILFCIGIGICLKQPNQCRPSNAKSAENSAPVPKPQQPKKGERKDQKPFRSHPGAIPTSRYHLPTNPFQGYIFLSSTSFLSLEHSCGKRWGGGGNIQIWTALKSGEDGGKPSGKLGFWRKERDRLKNRGTVSALALLASFFQRQKGKLQLSFEASTETEKGFLIPLSVSKLRWIEDFLILLIWEKRLCFLFSFISGAYLTRRRRKKFSFWSSERRDENEERERERKELKQILYRPHKGFSFFSCAQTFCLVFLLLYETV